MSLRDLANAVASFARGAQGTPANPGIRLTLADDSPQGARGMDRVFVGLGATIDAFPDVLRDAVPTIRKVHADNFRTEGSAGRGRWAPLAASTIERRIRRGYGARPILLNTGELRRHVLGTPAVIIRTGNDVTLTIRPTDTVPGTGRAYYRANALGTRRIPSRPMVTVGPQGAVEITSAVSRGLRLRAMGNGLGAG